MTTKLPSWIANVPLKTVGVLCATHIFGKNIDTRHIVLAGRHHLRSAVENVVGYILNPILPPIPASPHGPIALNDKARTAVMNIRDCFNYIFHIQVEYFKILHRIRPERFRSPRTGVDLHLSAFAAKGPTLINSEKRYLILSKIDGAQPFDLDLDWNAQFDWTDDRIRELFRLRLGLAQDAYGVTLKLGSWYAGRDKNLIIPLKTIMDDLSEYFEHLGIAAYVMARKRMDADEKRTAIRENLFAACRHLERFVIDMLRVNMFSIVKHDLDKLDAGLLDAVIKVRADDDHFIMRPNLDERRIKYDGILRDLYRRIEFEPAAPPNRPFEASTRNGTAYIVRGAKQ